MKLTAEQGDIVNHGEGHAVVSAVAGSGKTTTMVARVRNLLEKGVNANHLLILMFNKSARDAFADKLHHILVQTTLQPPKVRTFHSLGLRLTNSFSGRGALPRYTLRTEEFLLQKLAKDTIRHLLDQGDGREEWLSRENMETFLSFIDLVKSSTLPVATLFDSLHIDQRFDYFIEAFPLFEKSRKAQKIRFYADLIHDPVTAMLADPQLADWVGNRMEHIIVDEYQDINEVQQQLLQFLAGNRANVMAVGDVDQCIYEWRGAKPEYITSRFQHDFPRATPYTLSHTFRYGHRLSLAANHLISNNRMRDKKLCLSFSTTVDSRIECLEETTPHPVISVLNQWQEDGNTLKDAVILLRMFGMGIPVELALLEAGIPYHLQGHDTVFACPEIKALIGYLQFCQGSLDKGDSHNTIDTLEAMLSNPHLGLKREKITLLARKIAEDPERAPEQILARRDKQLPRFLQIRLEESATLWREIQKLPSTTKASYIIDLAIRKNDLFSFYHKISSRSSSAENKIKTCQAFLSFARRLALPIPAFLEKIRQLQQQECNTREDHVLLTSIHRAKGLEWPLVILPGLEDGFFPLLTGDRQEAFDNLEDERRLFYVAATRAIQRVVFTHPPDAIFSKHKKMGTTRFPVNDNNLARATPASRFLYEANLQLSDQLGQAIFDDDIEGTKKMAARDSSMANRYLKAINSSILPFQTTQKGDTRLLEITDLAEGVMVKHPFFGRGVVTDIIDRRTGKVGILFDEQNNEKVLMTKVAKLTAA